MASVVCDICFEGFSEAERVPKMLGCGHTFCLVCLDNLLESRCPTCKTAITLSLGEYATNFIVLKLTEITEEKSKCLSSHISSSLKSLEKIFLLRKEMVLKSIEERTSLKNLITNDITRLRQMLEMDQDILNATDAESLISELEGDVEKIDEILSCGKLNLKPTYSMASYINTSCYLYKLVNRLHGGEDIYAYNVIHNSKPKYGKITLETDRIDVHALTESKVNKGVALVSFLELRKCITKDNFHTFIEIEIQKLSFSIINSSYFVVRFIKLCTGETGPTFKGVNGAITASSVSHPRNPGNYIIIDKCLLNNVETEGCNDYDLEILFDKNESTCSEGEVVVMMFPDGSCEIAKCVYDKLSYRNVVAKMVVSHAFQMYDKNPAVIKDSGISLIF